MKDNEQEYPEKGDEDHPTSSHLLRIEERAMYAFNAEIRRQWVEDNKETWNL
jgi:hypothetical protein